MVFQKMIIRKVGQMNQMKNKIRDEIKWLVDKIRKIKKI